MRDGLAQPPIAQQALREAVAVDAEVDDLEPGLGRLEDGRPGRLLRDAAAGRERVAEDEHPARAGRDRRGGVAASARAEVVRLPPAVGVGQ